MTDYTWDGGGDGTSWNDDDNWGGSGHPNTNNDKATINVGSASISMNIAGGTGVVGEVYLGSGFTGTVTQAYNFTVDSAGSENGALEINNSSATWNCNGSTLTVDSHISGNGTLTVGTSTVTCTGQTTVGIFNITTGTYNYFDDFRPTTANITDNATINQTSTGGQLGGRLIITASKTPTFNAIGRFHSSFRIDSGDQGNSTINLDLSEPQTGPSRALFFYNLELDSEGTENNKFTMGGAITCTNNLTITDGEIDTGSNHALSVGVGVADGTSGLLVGSGGTLTCNSSAVEVNGLKTTGGTVTLPDSSGSFTVKGTAHSGYGIHDTSGSGNIVHSSGTVTWDTGGLSTIQAKSTFNNITTATSGTDMRWFDSLTLAGALTVAANTDVFEHASAGGNLTITGAVSVSGKLGNSDAYSAYEFGSLTIESGGEYHATDGTTTCNGNVNVKSSGTFTHNDGTFLWENTTGDSITGFGAGAPAFYNLEISSSTSNDIFPEWDFTVRNVFDTNGQQIWIHPNSRDVTITMGFSDATAVSTGATTAGLKTGGYINSTLKSYQNHLNDIKIYGASQVYHAKLADAWLTFTHTSQADCTWYIKNLNVQSTFNTTHTAKTGSNAIVILDGDCEFTGVTVTGGDTLDLNGWVMTCSDTVTGLAGSSVFQDTAGNGILSCKTLNQSNTQSMSNSNLIITGVGTCDVQSQWKNVLYNLGSSTLSGYRGWGTNSNVIFGSGVLEQTTRDNTQYTINNIQIVGGATFTPVVGDKTLTVAGDWTSSGGLLGTSCLHCDASSNYYASSASINFRSDSARDYSVEFWMKPDSVTNSETDRLVHSDQKFAIWKYEDDIVFAPNYDVAFTASAVLTAGKWTHVACTWDASDNALEIFIDGKVVQTGTDTTTDKTGAASIRIGRKDDGTQEFDGYIDEVRLWEDKRTATEIKTDMFQGGTLANSGDLFARWSLDEGAGTSSTDSSSNSNNLTLNDAGGWIGAGTFTEGTSTVDMTGTGKTMTFNGDTEFYNLTVAGSGKTTNIYNKLNVASALYINSGGTLTHGGGTFQVSGGSSGYYPNVVCKGTYSANANFEDLYTFYWVGNSVSHVQPAGKFNYLIYDNAYNSSVNYDVTLAGNITGSNYVAINDACSLNTRSSGVNYNIDTARLIMRSTASLTLNNSTLKFTNTQGFDINYTGNTLSAGPGCTISGTNAATTFKSQNHWNVVGNITNLKVTNEELKVTGMVTDCTGLIHQMNPTQDADQQLDKDTADDRDVQFASLNIDRNTELVG